MPVVGSRVIQAVGSHINLANRGQQSYTVVQQSAIHHLPVQTISQNGKHALPVTSVPTSAYGMCAYYAYIHFSEAGLVLY